MSLIDISSIRWDSEQGMEDGSYMKHLQMDYLEFEALDEFKPPPQNYQNSSCNSQSFERSTKKIKTNTSWINPSTTTQHISPKNSSSSSSHIISFGDSSSGTANDHQPFCGNLDSFVVPKTEVVVYNEDHMIKSPTSLKSYGFYDENKHAHQGGKGIKRGMSTRSPTQALDHVMAERKRRERLAERIIALSAIIPGLKKIDKASILGDAIKYLKHLQERVKQLEEQAKRKPKEESVVFVNKSNMSADEDSSSCEENSSGCFKDSQSEIEARFSEKNVLIRVHCKKKKGFVVKVIREIENLNLSVVNSSVLPFGNNAMDITIVAQMDAIFSLTVKDLVRNMQSALL